MPLAARADGELAAYEHAATGSRWTRPGTATPGGAWADRPGALEGLVNARRSGAGAACSSPATPASRAPGWRSGSSGSARDVAGFALSRRPTPSLHALVGRRAARRPGRHARRASRRGAVRAVEPEVVFHLAAQSPRAAAFADPAGHLRSQRPGHGPPARSRRGACPSVRAVVVVTSDKVYAPDGDGRRTPRTIRSAASIPYSASKAAAELVAAAYRARSFAPPASASRPRARAT